MRSVYGTLLKYRLTNGIVIFNNSEDLKLHIIFMYKMTFIIKNEMLKAIKEATLK